MRIAVVGAGFAALAALTIGCSHSPAVSDADDKAADAAIKELTHNMQPGDAMKKAMEPTAPPAGDTGPKTTIVNGRKVPLILTTSGLRYYDIKVGKGVTPALWQTVTVNYSETLLDGTKAFSSRGSNRPFDFPIEGLQGWEEGVFTMKIGGKRRLIVPSDMANVPPTIESGSSENKPRVFDVELLGAKENRDITHPTPNNLTD